MKVNMLEAKSQLSRLVKEALAGEDVVMASNGEPMVRVVAVVPKGGLRRESAHAHQLVRPGCSDK